MTKLSQAETIPVARFITFCPATLELYGYKRVCLDYEKISNWAGTTRWTNEIIEIIEDRFESIYGLQR